LYAQGLNMREWLYVSDCARALFILIHRGKIGEIYNISSGIEKRNIEVSKIILELLNKRAKDNINFVQDRPGHDYRYALSYSKIKRLGWQQAINFEQGILITLKWYRQNLNWLENKFRRLVNL
jgi:dTDP-glucose 4,6-dehydratase